MGHIWTAVPSQHTARELLLLSLKPPLVLLSLGPPPPPRDAWRHEPGERRLRAVLPPLPRRGLLRVRGAEILRARLPRPLRAMLLQVWRVHHREGDQGDAVNMASGVLLLRDVPHVPEVPLHHRW